MRNKLTKVLIKLAMRLTTDGFTYDHLRCSLECVNDAIEEER